MSLLQAQDISKHFGGLAALVHVSFSLKEGEILGLIGPNGAGKTTLFNVVNGFYPPSHGEVFISSLTRSASWGLQEPSRW
jgi:branched-chain amino acid transport system ATP-binding protein